LSSDSIIDSTRLLNRMSPSCLIQFYFTTILILILIPILFFAPSRWWAVRFRPLPKCAPSGGRFCTRASANSAICSLISTSGPRFNCWRFCNGDTVVKCTARVPTDTAQQVYFSIFCLLLFLLFLLIIVLTSPSFVSSYPLLPPLYH